MDRFRWLSAEAIPPGCDLRRCGWTLAEDAPLESEGMLLLGRLPQSGVANFPVAIRRATLLLGVSDGPLRAELLRLGFGEVLGPDTALDELAARAKRVVDHAACEPRRRHHGELVVDLLAREAYARGRPLGLHPREFHLLWRLMASPGVSIGRSQLLREVWHLNHEPETNSLAVHASRLRSKLRSAGFCHLIATGPGGYVYVPPIGPAPALPLDSPTDPLDAHVRLPDGSAAMEKVER